METLDKLLDELRSIAQLGLNYSKDEYDLERYRRLLDLSAQHYEANCGLSSDIIKERFQQELGYITPKVGVSASVFDTEGKQLLVKRTDDHTWCLPCGWAEVGESPQESLRREVLEETGLIVEVKDQIRLGYRMPGEFGLPHTTYHLQFYCTRIGGGICGSHETTDVGFYDMADIDNWHLDHAIEAKTAHQYWEAELNNK
ncbi:NUDIX hydrolase N-terminal domain-containing protein [uncultured Pseudoteredinibacter sp.]|uniref:NUDIX hydrolase N-terminal domain-containing protein n=1 Tax=uncultured Pseudoteredinibacter sp. TaxID=1641701 RepID=UPI002627DB61|nr:NUDIX hydrolase N-terminal domain-containing protein [uncultured Pseudoteredinibacter sp.]